MRQNKENTSVVILIRKEFNPLPKKIFCSFSFLAHNISSYVVTILS